MDSYARSCYPMAVQAIRDAMSKDSDGQTKEAYCCYLSSILFMIQALKDEAWEKKEIKDLCHDGSIKLYKLIEQSLGRARDILNAQNSDCGADHVHRQVSATLSAPTQSNSRPGSPAIPDGLRKTSNTINPASPGGIRRTSNTISPASPGGIRRTSNTSTTLSTSGLISLLPTPPGVIESLPTPPGYSELPSRSVISYQSRNYDMFQAYKHRKSKDSVLQKYASCSTNLSMFREMAEKKKLNDIKHVAYQEKLLERQQKIKIEAERRWNQMNARSSRDKEYRQNLLETILSYEQDARWPITMRDTLVLNNEDSSTITKVVRTILTYTEHPLCKVLKEIQFEIYSNIEPLIEDYKPSSDLAEDYYLVPVQDVLHQDRIMSVPSSSISDESESFYDNVAFTDRSKVRSMIDVNRDNETDNTAPSVDSHSNTTNLRDIEDDMFSSDSENEEDNNKPYNLLSTTSRTESSTTDEKENIYTKNQNLDDTYNHLSWQNKECTYEPISTNTLKRTSVNKIEDEEEEIYQDPTMHHNTTGDPSQYEGLNNYQENIYEDVNEVVASIIRSEHIARDISPVTLKRLNSEFLKTVDRIVQDIIFGIDRLHSVILLTYESMNNPIGRDISYANLECIFFKPIWPWLIRAFRKMNIDKEDAMAEVMKTYKNCAPSKISIRDKLALGADQNAEEEPYLEAIEEMKQVVQFTSPLDKLECTVRVSKAICHCVETYYSGRGERAPAVGCDDLLPILSYVVLKSQLPQIVSECHAMTEFIHDGYLMGEEGYCLTTLHAAISNLLSYAEPRL